MKKTKNLSIGQLLIIISAIISIVSLFMPWVDFKLLTYSGFKQLGFIPFLCYIYPLYKIIVKEKYDGKIGFALGCLAIIITIILKSKFKIEEYGIVYDSTSYGIYVFLISSLVFTLGNYLVCKENGDEIIESKEIRAKAKKFRLENKDEIKDEKEIVEEKINEEKIELEKLEELDKELDEEVTKDREKDNKKSNFKDKLHKVKKLGKVKDVEEVKEEEVELEKSDDKILKKPKKSKAFVDNYIDTKKDLEEIAKIAKSDAMATSFKVSKKPENKKIEIEEKEEIKEEIKEILDEEKIVSEEVKEELKEEPKELDKEEVIIEEENK